MVELAAIRGKGENVGIYTMTDLRFPWRDQGWKERRRCRMEQAYNTVWRAVKRGKLSVSPVCEDCGADGKVKHLEPHHDSYADKDVLKVRWLCRGCHNKANIQRKMAEVIAERKKDIEEERNAGM